MAPLVLSLSLSFSPPPSDDVFMIVSTNLLVQRRRGPPQINLIVRGSYTGDLLET